MKTKDEWLFGGRMISEMIENKGREICGLGE